MKCLWLPDKRRRMIKTIFLLSLIFIFTPFLDHPSVVSAETSYAAVSKVDVSGLHSMKSEELLDILNIKIGDAFNPSAVRAGLKLAFLKGIFEDISVEVKDEDRTFIIVRVRERDIIKKIVIAGNKRLSKKIIRNHFSFKEDQIMRYDRMENAVKELKNALHERGFPHADIKPAVENAGAPYSVNLLLAIDEGMPEIIKSIKITGPADAKGHKELIKIEEGDIYDQVKLRKEIDKMRLYYKKNNFLKPVVGPYTFSSGNLDVNLDPGKKLEVIFENNSALSSEALAKEAPFFEVEDFGDDLVEEAISRIVSLYHSMGFPYVQVAPVITSDKDTVVIRFFIFEGSEVVVDSDSFEGITISEKNLKDVMLLKKGKQYNPDLIESDKAILTEFYNALGYLNAVIDDVRIAVKDSKADIIIKVKEGAKTLIEGIEIKGTIFISKKEIINAVRIKTGDPYNEVDISDARHNIIDLYSSNGFIDSRVDIKREAGEKGVKIIFEIDEGKLSLFGKTVISGNADTKNEVIKREMLYENGAPFNPSLLTKTRQRLYKIGLFTEVDVEPIEKEGDKKDVHIRVKEAKAGAVEVGAGYGDYERFRGSFDISYRNLFGMNRQLSFRTEISTLEQRYIVNYTEPWFLGNPLPFKVFLIKEERTEKSIETRETRYKLRRHTASVGLEKKFSERVKGEIFYDFSLVKTFEVKPDVILTKEDVGTLAIAGIRPGIVYDTRDNPFDPRKGVLAGISVKTASGYLLSETDFVKAVVNGSAYKALSKNFVVAVSLKSGMSQGFEKTTDLPLVERFFLGGRTTVRGYEQDTLGPKGVNGSPTGGNMFILTNLELRTDVAKGFGLVTFLDGGNVWKKNSDVKLSDMKYTAGAGIRYNTPVGPLRIDYGHKLDRETGESKGEVHFSIGHAF
ncbi:MAG TPA: outer membrane protein assembly factor BamA [Nitrospiraceae bacterium]|nr:outer membrane protein assembly factor BamA [Nitrospiraceae bacterium]